MIYQKIDVQDRARLKKPISIEKLIEWTFGAERAQLDPVMRDGSVPIPSHLGYRSSLSAFLQMEILGCRIDTSGAGASFLAGDGAYVHVDADAVSAVVAGVLERRVAELVAEHGRCGTRPAWMPGASPRVTPAAWNQNQHGQGDAATEPAGPSAWPGGVWRKWMDEARKSRRAALRAPEPLSQSEMGEEFRKHLGRCCPVVYEPSPQQIETARRTYVQWWQALHEVRERLLGAPVLKSHTLTREMPPAFPWLEPGESGIVEIGPRPEWRT